MKVGRPCENRADERHMKILIVEDSRDYRAMLYEFLHSQGHDVMAVCDALHAVALLNQNDCDIELALLDLRMPRLGGDVMMQTFAGWARCRTRFIVMSGELDVSDYEKHSRTVACLRKPFALEVLIEHIKRAEEQLAEAATEKAGAA
jgi:DNA-binding NtrC family response regulator